MSQTTTVAHLRQPPSELANIPDQAVDMFTERGFALANRVAKAFASSDAVPAQFRTHNLKKVGREEHWVENTAAVGNCLVAIEVARAVGMSIAAVMQNADMIEGKLRWSGKFVIAAINSSGRFTPLRFQSTNLGKITAAYKEKTGWDNDARRPIFTDRAVDIDNIECIAWALPKGFPEPRVNPEQMREYKGRMLDLYRDLGLPVIESAPVTLKMAVEEGWYAKPGSKWQTEMRALMFQYRAGSFFGNIHAPDIVMGMGQTSEEARDTQVLDIGADGVYTVSTETLRADMQRVDTDGVITNEPSPVMQQTATVQRQAEPVATPAPAPTEKPARAATQQRQQSTPPAFDINAFADSMAKCTDAETINLKADEVGSLVRDGVITEAQGEDLYQVYRHRRAELDGQGDLIGGQDAPAPTPAPAQQTRRRTSSAGTAPE